MRVADTVAALCVALLGAIAVALARQLPYEADYGPGAGFFPLWLGVALIVLSVFLLRDARKPVAAAVDTANVDGGPSRFLDFAPGAFTPWLIFFLCTVAVSILFDRLGFALSIGLFMFVTMRWVANQRWLATILLTIVTPIVLYVMFVRILMVSLPLWPPGF